MITSEEIKELRGILGISQKELADTIGVSLKTAYNYETGGVIPKGKQQFLYAMLLEARSKTGQEIRTGGGSPQSVGNSGGRDLKGPSTYSVYLLPLSAMGGGLTGFAADGVTLSNCEKIVSPIENVDFAITVYGESMAPKYPSGARLLIKKIDPSVFLDWGKPYVLDTSNGVIVKEVRKADKMGYIACYSINPDPKFEPFDVPMSEVRGVYRVLMSLSME